jgi:hypothetical protein
MIGRNALLREGAPDAVQRRIDQGADARVKHRGDL